jgi:hypothetical protein
MELEGGRDSLWWGQGYHGNLLLTNNGTPLDLVKLSNPSPILLPWFLSYLGPFKYNLFLSVLEEDRVVPHPWFAGIRFEIKPFPIFEMGVTTTLMFNGEGRPKLSFTDLLSLLLFQPQGGGDANKSNQLGAFDFRLRLPFLRNAEVYAEYGGDDFSGTDSPELFDDIGYLVGIYIPRVTEDGRVEFRFEYARNAHTVDQTPAFWYGHTIYQSGYTHDGLIMGHHMEGDSEDYFVRAAYYLRNDVKLGLDFDYMERGITLSPAREENYQMGVDVTYELTDFVTIRARYAYEEVKNFNLIQSDNRANQLLMTGLSWRF